MWYPRNVDEWREQIAANPIHRAMTTVRTLAEQIATGQRRSAIVCGPPGCGKSRIVRDVFREHQVVYRQANFGSAPALIQDLHDHRSGCYLIDDADGMLRRVDILNIIKRITDPDPAKRYLEHKTRNQETSIPKFEVRARVVILTNINFYGQRLLDDARLGPHIGALNSRCQTVAIPDDRHALWEYAIYLTVIERMLQAEGLTRAVTEQALIYFSENLWQLREVSPRRLAEIGREIQRSPDHWRQLLSAGLDPQRRSYHPPPFEPRLLPPVRNDRRKEPPQSSTE